MMSDLKIGLKTKFYIFLGILITGALALMPIIWPLDGETGSDIAAMFGRFHILLLHFPIALLFIMPILELLGKLDSFDYLKKAAGFVLFLGLIFVALTSLLGFLLAKGDGSAGELLEDHMWDGIIATGLIAAAIVFRSMCRENSEARVQWAYRISLGFSLITLTVGAHHGASLVHGEEYLVEKMPVPIKTAFGYKEPEALTFDSPLYASVIHPIFQENCFSCHSDKKQKGKYRMDQMDFLLAGGKSKKTGIVPGRLMESELYRRISLSRNSKGVMPPKEKLPLSPEDSALIAWWIESGASADKTIAKVSDEYYSEEVDIILTAMIDQNDGAESTPIDQELFVSVSTKLKNDYGVDLFPHSQDINEGLHFVSRNAAENLPLTLFYDLKPLAEYITEIDLWKRNLSEKLFSEISMYSALETVKMAETNITAKDLVHLTKVKHLKVLNIFGTEVGDDSIEQLSAMRRLRKLYIANTKISKNGFEQLKQALPRCQIYSDFISIVTDEESHGVTESRSSY